MAGNREYKSDVFSMLCEEPGYALEVYNALNQAAVGMSGFTTVHDFCRLCAGVPGEAFGEGFEKSDKQSHKSMYQGGCIAGISDTVPRGGDKGDTTGLYI